VREDFFLDDDDDDLSRDLDLDDEDEAAEAPSKHHRELLSDTGSYPAALHISAPFAETSSPTHSESFVQIVSDGRHGTSLCDESSAKKSSLHARYSASHARSQIGIPSATPTLASHTEHSTPAHASLHVSLNPFSCMCTTRTRTASVCSLPQHVDVRYPSQKDNPFPLLGFCPSRAYAANAAVFDAHVSPSPSVPSAFTVVPEATIASVMTTTIARIKDEPIFKNNSKPIQSTSQLRRYEGKQNIYIYPPHTHTHATVPFNSQRHTATNLRTSEPLSPYRRDYEVRGTRILCVCSFVLLVCVNS